jgi:hypothetical protein
MIPLVHQRNFGKRLYLEPLLPSSNPDVGKQSDLATLRPRQARYPLTKLRITPLIVSHSTSAKCH